MLPKLFGDGDPAFIVELKSPLLSEKAILREKPQVGVKLEKAILQSPFWAAPALEMEVDPDLLDRPAEVGGVIRNEVAVSLRRFRGHLNTAIMVAGGEVDVEENAKGTEIVHG
jgi:hypothetical protein